MTASDSLQHVINVTPPWLPPVLRTLVLIVGLAILAFADLTESAHDVITYLLVGYVFGEGALSTVAGILAGKAKKG